MLLRPVAGLPPMNLRQFSPPPLPALNVRKWPAGRLVVFNNRQETQQLRFQLDRLQSEAELTRTKSNNARLRLMRLTDKIENLKRRAANNVMNGKEEEAIELLVQKKKLVQALERLKDQIVVLDKLSAKINEAISLKQNKLIERVSKETQISNREEEYEMNKVSIPIPVIPSGPLSFRDFLVNIDKKLGLLESDIEKFVLPHLLIEDSKNRLADILKDLLGIREMIASFIQSMEDDN
ncbi:hypothetical protein LUZ60_008124 [Juncus effusus]|nr:hypothetical protein LUZ60_008124 [Juncus effusus]